MNIDWPKTNLGDVCEIIMGQSPKSDYYNQHGEGLPFLQGNRTFGQKYPIFDTFTTAITKIANPNDVIMSVRAPVGELNITPIEMCLGRGVCALRMKNGEQAFLFYLMKEKVKRLIHQQTGTVFCSVNHNDISRLEIHLPPLPIQRSIAETLSCLDDKIELNNRINAILEAQAQAIFKSWFVDFEPFLDGEFLDSELGNIPKGWQVAPLSDLINIKYGKAHQSLQDGSFPVYGSGGFMRYAEEPLYDKESVLIPRKGILNNIMFVDEPFLTVDTMFYSEMKISNIAKYVFLFLKTKDLASMNAGTAVPSMTIEILNNMQVLRAPDKVFMEYENIMAAIFKSSSHNKTENRTLAKIRDIILPRLMSGEIECSSKINIKQKE